MILRGEPTPLLSEAILDHRQPATLARSTELHAVMPDFIVAALMTEYRTNQTHMRPHNLLT
jgi:hypothetical protein